MQTIQRGASNAYFAKVAKSILIPPHSQRIMKVLNEKGVFNIMEALLPDPPKQTLEYLAKENGVEPDELLAGALALQEGASDTVAVTETTFRRAEYDAFTGQRPTREDRDDFDLRPVTEDAFFRMMLAPPVAKDNETAFFIMTFKYLDWMEKKGGYEQYRRKRTERAMIYAQGVLEKHPHLKRIVGISREPPEQGRGVSEDIIYAEQSDWTADERKSIRDNCNELGILQQPLKMRPVEDEEYPELTQITFTHPGAARKEPLNRKERRKQSAKQRKTKRK